ncbi:MAG TPA: 4-hydroxybenzoate 3-monooxygenase [Candidatus Dormibacteraeota bacterium]
MDSTQVAIIGAGPAGLMLSHLLHLAGVESVVLELRSRDYVEARVRAGVLEDRSAALLRDAGVGARMDREGLIHRGIQLQFGGERHRIDFEELTGRTILVYGQQEVVKDLIEARLAASGALIFEAEVLSIDQEGPAVTYVQGGESRVLRSEVIAACDGSHGVGREAVADASVFKRVYPHAWLGVLARTPPASEELIYACHANGFALLSMRSPEVSRLYLQVRPDEDLAEWPTDRIWSELRTRLGEPSLREGEFLDVGFTPMRSLVIEPMHAGSLFLAGDAAHIVPPTGAKGMNLALADVTTLARALAERFRSTSTTLLDSYSADCSGRIWRAEHFSWFMTNLLHRDPDGDPFGHRLQLANLANVVSSRAAATALAENYVGAATEGIRI